MEVLIKEQSFEYISDFDVTNLQLNVVNHWKVSAGDYFKFPITVGAERCFVKRFDKSEEEISGFGFIKKIKGKVLAGLPQIYDIVTVTEASREIVYIFMEYLEGDTVENYQKDGFSFLPVKLAGDLFFALESMHKNGYWFPDFDPKNLFINKKGDCYLIDLDSAYPLSEFPRPNMFGSKDYWKPVYDFYRSNKGYDTSTIKQIRGDTFNKLHLLYFMALYSYYLQDEGEDLTPTTISRLNDYLLANFELFASTMHYCFRKDLSTDAIVQHPLSYQIFSSFLNNCLFTDTGQHYISTKSRNNELAVKPKIKFTVKGNNRRAFEGDRYTLEWQTINASEVFLDGVSQALKGSREFEAEETITHVLKASNKKGKFTESRIGMTVETIPPIMLSAEPASIRSGEIVTIRWMVTKAEKITLFMNDQVCQENCLQNDSLVLALKNSGPATPANFRFVVKAYAPSGSLIRESDEMNVLVSKKKFSYTWLIIILVIMMLAVLIYFLFLQSFY